MSLNGEGADVTVTPPPVLLSDSGGVVILPDAAMVFDAEFVRANTDLILRNSGAPDIRVTDYFKQAEPSDLVTQDGAVLRGATVQRLAGPEAPGQYAQAGSANAANPIGQVEAVSGQAQVQRADGAVDDLQVGTKIFTDDVLQTGEAANLSVTFVDGTIFTLAPESRMVVDALIYDPDSQDNAGAFSLIQGGFVFIAGQVAATGGMEVQTPSSTMGIRGTTVLVDLQTNGAITTTAVTLTRDPDGGLGRVELFDLSGNLITTITSTTTKWIVSTLQGETREVDRTAEDEAEDSVLLIEAVAAYQSAFARFEQGGTFVELDRVGRGDGAADFGDSDVDLDSIDDEPVPEVTPPSLPDPQNGGSFDEGNLDIEGVIPSERVIVLTGFEDSAEDAEFSGSLAALTSGAGTFSLVSTPQNGTVDLQTDGTYSFVPDLNFNGTDQFRYDLVGPSGVLESGTVQITVLPVNDAPQIEPDNRSVDEDIILTGLAAATDVDGDDLQYTLGTGAQNGSASVARDGAWSYTADPDFAGQDSFEIVVTDAAGAQATQAVNIDVIGQPDAPRITSDISDATGGVVEDDAPQIGGTLTATDPDAGATLSWSGSTAGSVGTFVISAAGVWTYTLAAAAQMLQADETVAESFVATVTDDTGLVASQVVNITVTGTNDTPIIVSDASNATGNVIETSSPVATGVLTATDVDAGAELAWSGSETGSLGVFEISPDGAWSYMLGTAAEGLAAGQVATESFTATVTDGLGGVADQTVTLTVTGSNDGPVITSAGSAAQGAVVENVAPVASGVLTASDVDDGATLTWAGTATGALGTFTIDPTGAWTYTLTAAADGLAEGTTTTEAFVATVSDGQGATATQTVTVSITGRNDAPMVVAEQSVAQGMATENTAPVATGLLIASDADLDATLRWSGTASGDFGDFTITEDGAWSYTLNAAAEALAAGQVERESFTALVTDDQGAVATQVVTTTIVGTNDAPTAEAFDIEVTQGQTVMALLTADDIDINDVLDFALAPSAAPAGAVELASDGTLSYTGASDFVGLDQFDYVVSDGAGGSFAATVSVFVESAEQTGTGGQKVTLNIYPDPVVGPAGTIVTTASAANSSNVNLVVALDRSGSIGEEAWETKINAVADALAEIAPTFDGAQTQVDVQIITYATTSQVEGTFDLTDPALLTTLRTLPFTGGGTNWDQPLEQAEAFYDAQPAGEVNFLYFITDGDPSNNAWEPVLARLTDAETKGYDLVIEAFGIGNDVALNASMTRSYPLVSASVSRASTGSHALSEGSPSVMK
ncbi:MAG: Ig-like domain-containing protein [Pseudomonadota bacterium]